MTVAQILEKMIAFSQGSIHDIDHLLRVWAYTKTIAELEGVDDNTRLVLEVAAITHDIACPLCRERYGNTNGKHQEEDGARLVEAFLAGTGLSTEQVERVRFLVGHHHTYTQVEGIDWQILLEADFIANACEGAYPRERVEAFLGKVAKTSAGTRLTRSVFQL